MARRHRPRTTRIRREREGRLSPEESERLERLARLTTLAAMVLESETEATDWMLRPHPLFGDEKPAALARTEVLIVPAVTAQPLQQHILLNPLHPDFARIALRPPKPIVWDVRLFGKSLTIAADGLRSRPCFDQPLARRLENRSPQVGIFPRRGRVQRCQRLGGTGLWSTGHDGCTIGKRLFPPNPLPTSIADLQAALADRYRIERELGRGGMATVYLAHDLRHDRPVALKLLRPELAAALGPERFLRETKLTARLQHPHILPLFDSGEASGQLWYVMPYVEGESLRTRLARERQLPLDDALRITRNVLAALSYAHSQGVVHRDIKPENILLEGEEAVVADFGVARAANAAADERLTETGLALGTPAYMSPEQSAGERALDGRSDIYAVGCVLYEMLAGEPPFTGPTAQAILAKRFSAPIPSVRIARQGVPDRTDKAIARALARVPADRFATAADFARALSAESQADERSDSETLASRPAKDRRFRRVVLTSLGMLAVIVGGWAIMRRLASPVPAGSPTRLAVLPFSTSGSSKIAYLADGMVDLLSRNLNGAGDLRTIDPGSVLTATARAGKGAPDTETGRALARRLGAGLFVLGSAHAVGGRLRIQAELYSDADTAEGALARATAEGDTTQLFQLVDRLSADLLAGRGRGLSSRLMQSAALTTHSLEALKAYLKGEHNLRGGDGQFDSAIAGFQRAVAEDSTFALAYYRLGVAAGWAERPGISGPATERALVLGARLDDRDRRLLSAFAAFQRGAADDAEQQYRAILRDYPDDLEAEFQLADLLKHYNPPRGRPIAEAKEPFDHVLAQDPGFLCPI